MANEKLVQGPVPNWEPSEENKETIAELLSSDREIDKAYGEVYQAGCFVVEFAGIAAVGEMNNMVIAQFRLDTELDTTELGMGDCMSLGAYPGTGDTREERVRDALKQALEAREKNKDPDALELFGSFTESGYIVDAFMPRNSSQATQWTIRVRLDGEEDVIREVTVPMIHEPIFGVDVADKAALEARVEQIMNELTKS